MSAGRTEHLNDTGLGQKFWSPQDPPSEQTPGPPGIGAWPTQPQQDWVSNAPAGGFSGWVRDTSLGGTYLVFRTKVAQPWGLEEKTNCTL